MVDKKMWDWMDKAEGKKVGSSYSNLMKEKNRIKNLDSVRARPKEHLRRGSVTSKGYRSPSVVNAGLSISQVGAKPVKHRNHTYYKIGGGLFTKKQVLESRRRYGQVKYNIKVSKEQVGLK